MTPDLSKNRFIQKDALPIPEIAVLWMTAGLGCDGDTIAVTAATHFQAAVRATQQGY
jgi:hypothetical protein